MHSKKYFIANWKMNGLKADLNQISKIDNFLKKKNKLSTLNCIFCIPYTILGLALINFNLKKIKIGAQDVSYEAFDFGPCTGQISSKMLKDLNCKFVIIGHSEKRFNGDTEQHISQKIGMAVKNNLKVILCVGESLKDYKDNKSFSKDKKQLELSLKKNKKYLKSKFKINATVIYGGSVSSKNINELKNIDLCDGFLIGGASLKHKNFIEIIKKYYN